MYTQNIFSLRIAEQFPLVKDFRVEHIANVEPVEYFDGINVRHEYPPVATWRVGNTRYRYVGKPSFVYRDWRVGLFSGVDVVTEYKDEERLFTALELSSAGHDAKYINSALTDSWRAAKLQTY